MKRKKVIAISVIIIFAVSLTVLGYNWYRSTQVDTSWVEPANSMLNNYPSYVNRTQNNTIPVTLAFLRMYVYENGTEHLLYYGNGDALSNYLENQLRNATIQKGTTTQAHLEEIVSSSKVIQITYRLFDLSHTPSYSEACFILEDKLNQNLQGTIIARELQSGKLYILAVNKLP